MASSSSGDGTVALGLSYLKIESVGLVNGLDGTGGDSGPSSLRSALIGEMQSYDVRNPQKLLESPAVSARRGPRISAAGCGEGGHV